MWEITLVSDIGSKCSDIDRYNNGKAEFWYDHIELVSKTVCIR